MDIRITLSEFPTKKDMFPLLNKSPLSGYRLEQKLSHRSDLGLMELLNSAETSWRINDNFSIITSTDVYNSFHYTSLLVLLCISAQ